MLNENIKTLRKSKCLSQEDLAVRLNVVRQTVSKWEQGLSVPDADMLIKISEVFETPVSVLLGETVSEPQPDDVKVLAEKLENINLMLARRKITRRKILHLIFILFSAAVIFIFAVIAVMGSLYRGFDFSDPEYAVIGTGVHIFEWIFVRAAPFALIGGIIGAVLTRKRG